MSRYLVTGGCGFIGLHLSRSLLADGHNVVLCDNLSRGALDDEAKEVLRSERATFLQTDLTHPDGTRALEGMFDGVYHLAAVNGTKNFYEIPHLVLRTNLLTTIYLLEWLAKARWAQQSRFLFSSSGETYAGTIDRDAGPIPTAEDVLLSVPDVFNARWSYGGSKIAGELLVINYCRQHKIPFSVIRYHNIYGPRMGFEHVIPEFSKRILDGAEPFYILGGTETRAFCHWSDAVRATRLALEHPAVQGRLVHIGNAREEIAIQDLALRLFKVAGIKRSLELRPAPPGSVSRRCPDTRLLETLTGYAPQMGIDEGLVDTYAWYRRYWESRARDARS